MANPLILYDNIFNDSSSIIMSTTAGDSTTSCVSSSYPVIRLHNGSTSDYCQSTVSTGTLYISTSRYNLVDNGDFENNTSGWTLESGTGSVATLTRNSTTPLRGNGDLKLYTTTSGTSLSYAKSSYFDLTSSDTYQVNFRAKSDATQDVVLSIKDFAGNSLDTETVSITSSATTYTWNVSDLSYNYTDCYLEILPTVTGTIYLDDIYVAKVDAVDTLWIAEGHTLYGCNCTLYASDSPYLDGTYETLISQFTPTSNSTILKTAATGKTYMYYVLKVENINQTIKIPEISIGAAWKLNNTVVDGYNEYSKKVNYRDIETETGKLIRRKKYSYRTISANYKFVLAAEVTKWRALQTISENYNIIWCYDSDNYPERAIMVAPDPSIFNSDRPYFIYTDLQFTFREVL